jgi:hypothetical protein
VATLLQLQSEPWWNQEFTAPTLAKLAANVRTAFHLPVDAVGTRGDTNHLRGYHRSAAWVRNSQFCTNQSYSVSETVGNRNPGDSNWVCALDIGGMSQEDLMTVCQRVDAGVRSGRFEKITEWYGNINGDQRVDGYDNIRNVLASSDSSHLVHLHLSFDRRRVGEDHSDVLAMLTGADMLEEKFADGTLKGKTVAQVLTDMANNAYLAAVRSNYLANTLNLDTRLTAIAATGVAIRDALASIGVTLTAEQLTSIATAAHDGAVTALDGVTITSKIDKAP